VSHYETLGVPRTATADEIKQAFRRKASAAHPDKGGSAEDMAAINRAYEVLGDETRRAAYDESGLDAEVKPVEAEARDALLSLFDAAMKSSDGNWLQEVSSMLTQHRNGLSVAQSDTQRKLDRLVKRVGKVRVKSGENLVEMLLGQQVKQLRSQLANVARGIEVNKAASAMLTAYELEEEKVQQWLGVSGYQTASSLNWGGR
jgi:curved DNA-binding protein CbpA